ncbi:hypothetical protein CBL_07014 [Carabus blaptoides fortunei]
MTHYPAHSRIYHIKADSLETPKLENSKSHHNTIGHRSTKLKANVTDVSPSLTGLLAHYNSDSDQEETNVSKPNKLVDKVDDFLQEINQLVPTKDKDQHNKENASVSNAWQECFDESTGYPYYWNVETNDVTWEMPQEYRDRLTKKSVADTQASEKPIIQPEQLPVNNVNTKLTPNEMGRQRNTNKTKRKVKAKKTRRSLSDSEDEKIVMITSFSEGSGSESDNEKQLKVETKSSVGNLLKQDQPLVVMGPHIEDIPEEAKHTPTVIPSASDMNKKEIIEPVKEEKLDETVILSRLRTQAKVLQELGGELPKSVDKSIICSDKTELLSDIIKPQSLALVACYGDDSEPENEPPPPTTMPSLFPIPNEPKEINLESSQSTLFPVTKPIDVKQFETPINNVKPQTQSVPKETEEDSLVHNKVFKRKKRLGVVFGVPQVKNEKRAKITSEPAVEVDSSGEVRKGLGFQDECDSNSNETVVLSDKSAFKKGNIAFVKADVLNIGEQPTVKNDTSENADDDIEDFQEIKDLVSEKVSFLGEGKPPVSPVQIMSIQLQTLEAAYKANGLSRRYLYTWLRETSTELGKLEQDAAPDGWQCQWDRSNRRYFYRNQQTGETQWDYPEPDIVGGGEAMDICTTPPPVNDEPPAADELVPPSPPAITADRHIPTPPPPPTLEQTAANVSDNKVASKSTQNQSPIPLTVEVAPPSITVSDSQPLPPGVDSPDLPASVSKSKDTTESDKRTVKDSLGSELDSFYSDIAMLEATSVSGTETVKLDVDNVPSPTSAVESTSVNDAAVKKKKKSKSKLGQGINMKKKAVSSLVEKWKKVQNDYL